MLSKTIGSASARSICRTVMARPTRRLFSMQTLKDVMESEIAAINDAGTYKHERIITSSQDRKVTVDGWKGEVLNFCANNYLGLSDDPDLVEAAKATLDTHGFGLSSVRFICGTQDIHKELEAAITVSISHFPVFPSVFVLVSSHGMLLHRTGVPWHRGHDSVSVLLRRQRGTLRIDPDEGRRCDL